MVFSSVDDWPGTTRRSRACWPGAAARAAAVQAARTISRCA